jgi:hypothetical protein
MGINGTSSFPRPAGEIWVEPINSTTTIQSMETWDAPSFLHDTGTFQGNILDIPLRQEAISDAPVSVPPGSVALFTIVQRPIRSRSVLRSYTPQEWESQKHRIKKLYLDDGKTLNQVKQIMADTYNFHVT